ncbi:hypothetical protein B0T22DRAFT_292218 [Podospora appendiculata]|uniref:Uncharacterized protein n=1 Tax=Podospora appendiculata TaxID=314037 RepID=A0AAE0X197_9PEZI|nr:hypothetical protein B0T22DRAFT_292218 [Podospora appendiculata]
MTYSQIGSSLLLVLVFPLSIVASPIGDLDLAVLQGPPEKGFEPPRGWGPPWDFGCQDWCTADGKGGAWKNCKFCKFGLAIGTGRCSWEFILPCSATTTNPCHAELKDAQACVRGGVVPKIRWTQNVPVLQPSGELRPQPPKPLVALSASEAQPQSAFPWKFQATTCFERGGQSVRGWQYCKGTSASPLFCSRPFQLPCEAMVLQPCSVKSEDIQQCFDGGVVPNDTWPFTWEDLSERRSRGSAPLAALTASGPSELSEPAGLPGPPGRPWNVNCGRCQGLRNMKRCQFCQGGLRLMSSCSQTFQLACEAVINVCLAKPEDIQECVVGGVVPQGIFDHWKPRVTERPEGISSLPAPLEALRQLDQLAPRRLNWTIECTTCRRDDQKECRFVLIRAPVPPPLSIIATHHFTIPCTAQIAQPCTAEVSDLQDCIKGGIIPDGIWSGNQTVVQRSEPLTSLPVPLKPSPASLVFTGLPPPHVRCSPCRQGDQKKSCRLCWLEPSGMRYGLPPRCSDSISVGCNARIDSPCRIGEGEDIRKCVHESALLTARNLTRVEESGTKMGLGLLTPSTVMGHGEPTGFLYPRCGGCRKGGRNCWYCVKGKTPVSIPHCRDGVRISCKADFDSPCFLERGEDVKKCIHE